jgi:uncharacterized protein (TIGR00255 family)
LLLSMTGFGEARHEDERLSVLAEIRAVNNRHLKLTTRVSDPYAALEPELERLVRETVRRGTVQLTLRVDRPHQPGDYRLNLVALESYRAQLQGLQPDGPPPDLAALLALPGVVEDRKPQAEDPHEHWPILSQVVATALGRFQASRSEEGRAMAAELLALGRSLEDGIERVARRGPEVVESYHARLTERVQSLLTRHGLTVEPELLIREVAILAERSDVSEEITRMRAHLAQYAEVIEGSESAGRRLEFVVQEMGREINTIGSKANDVEISRAVVELKGQLEKVRELIQNVE